MCGIVGAIAAQDITAVLVEGLKRLEYRGYDSTGVAVSNGAHHLELRRAVGKVVELERKLNMIPCHGTVGVAHSRWATHGGVTELNAHPHVSSNRIALIHNGIIENHVELKNELQVRGYTFSSETDTEVISHLVHEQVQQGLSLMAAVQAAVKRLHGAYAIVVFDAQNPDSIVVARLASPLVIGLADGANYVASDVQALLQVTRRFHFLEDGDVAEVRREGVTIVDVSGARVTRAVHESSLSADAIERGEYPHYMLKEIYEQPRAIADTLSERIAGNHVLEAALGRVQR